MSEQGIVKWYSIAKGYGFIRRQRAESESPEGTRPGDEGTDDQDIFVHYSDVADAPLSEGERVRFELVSSPKGPKARNVTQVDCNS